MNEIVLNRRIRLWRYEPSHSQLVYVSGKDDDNPTRKILIFKHVRKINSLTWFFCTSLKSTIIPEGKLFELLTEDESQTIEAYDLISEEDEGEYDSPIKQLEWLYTHPSE